ncbi:MAG: pilin, partial [Candidatus Saccharimonadales bacterium]
MNSKKHLFRTGFLALAFAMALVSLTPFTAKADLFDGSKQAACSGAEQSDAATCDSQSTGATINSKIKAVITIISLVVGVIAVIMLFVGGLKYITSTGDAAKVTSAKDTILYAIIGLIVVAFAQLIVRFTLKTAETPTKAPTNQQQKS